MRFPVAAVAALAFTMAASPTVLHAQSTTPGSSLGGGTSAGGAAVAASKAGVGGGGAVVAVPEDFSKLKIAPGFLLDAEVFDESDLSGQFRVGPDGNVILPFAGAVHVAGETEAAAQQKIQNAYKSAGILKYPQVTLNILQYAPTMITVLGEVNSPGRLQMLSAHSLLDVLSFVGGETQLAGGKIEVRHEEDGRVETSIYHYGHSSGSNVDAISKVMVHDGDTVIVPRAGIVYVLGQVMRPGGYLMQEDGKLDAAQAISMAMGTTLIASTHHILIIRRKPDGTFVQFEASYRDIVKGKVAPPQLQPQDIVYVPNSRIKTAFTDLQSLLTAASTATIYRTVE